MNTHRQIAERLGLPWREYIGLTPAQCKPLNWTKNLCLKAANYEEPDGYERVDASTFKCTKENLARCGEPWPRKKGWKLRIHGMLIKRTD
jgi:hypothetical protein